jgi:hypothetical protein
MAPNTHSISLERGRLGVVLATVVINVAAVSLLTFAPWSDWRTGAALNIVDNCLLIGFTLVRQDASDSVGTRTNPHRSGAILTFKNELIRAAFKPSGR